MKNRLNLYQADMVPKLDLLSLSSVLVAWVTITSLLLIVWGSAAWYGIGLKEKYTQAQVTQRNLQKTVDNMQAELKNRKPDAELEKLVEAKQKQLDRQERLLAEFAKREVVKQAGFSGLLSDLAAQSQGDLWLSEIAVDEVDMTMTGEVNTPEAFPVWMQRLAETNAFSGKTFDEARVYREENILKFELRSQRGAENGGQGDE